MATVRISKQFISDVTSHINVLRDQEIKAEGLADSYSVDYKGMPSPLSEFILWGDHHHIKDEVPEDWCGKADDVDFRFRPGGSEGPFFYVTGKDTAGIKVPPKLGTYRPDVDLTEEFIMDDANMARFPEIRVIRKQYAKAKLKYDIQQKWANNCAVVQRFFESKPSVNQALKAHESMRLYVPKKYLDIIDREVERTAPDIDADNLAAQVVAVRLRQSVGA